MCCMLSECLCFFFFKQKTAYEMRISDWSSDVCSSDLAVFNGDSVADPAGASRMVQDAIDNFGRIDIIVNNAGIVVSDHVHEEPGPLYIRNFDILLNGPLLIVRAAWEIMKAQGYGRKIGREHA